jgi:serine/threonine protein phosphatase 1
MVTLSPAPAALPPGQRIYAIGDVHGCADRLIAMHRAIAADLAERPIAEALLIHMGDYIDRGPDSAEVIAALLRGPAVRGVRVLKLMGNHEDMLLGALASGGNQSMAENWLDNGGTASLRSWGVPLGGGPAEWERHIPPEHLDFIRGLTLRHSAGGYLFVHAGVRPGVPLHAQSIQDMLWIREPFLSFTGDFGVVVVHGHTPMLEPVVRPNRVGIDTGAVMGGRLTCAVFEADRLGFISL